jgi:DNA-directed RNA polymerase subunit RPC12/RpoP
MLPLSSLAHHVPKTNQHHLILQKPSVSTSTKKRVRRPRTRRLAGPAGRGKQQSGDAMEETPTRKNLIVARVPMWNCVPKAMSEFKFACPVCGQHITADSNAAGSRLECPTCFRKIVVPQAPAVADPKFILSATMAEKPRPPQSGVPSLSEPHAPKSAFPVGLIVTFVVLCAAGATLFLLRGKFSKPGAPGNLAAQNHGAIGLASWNTRVEYTNVVVKKGKKTLFQSDFSSGTPDWRFHNGAWTTDGGVFRQTAIATDCRAIVGDPSWRDYTVSLRARKLGGREGFIVLFNVVDDQNWIWWNLGGWGNTKHAVESSIAGKKTTLGESVLGHIDVDHWYDIRIELKGARIRCFLDGTLVHDVNRQVARPATRISAQ